MAKGYSASRLTITAAPDTGFISADPSQLGQVLLNLAINARDALPHGGALAIETSNVEVATQREGERLGLPVGRYVMLTVRDNGTGMDEGPLHVRVHREHDRLRRRAEKRAELHSEAVQGERVG